jgi:predicted acyltransferase
MAVLGLLLIKFPGNQNYVYPFLYFSEGEVLTDMVYSFFLFAIGVSMFYSFSKYEFSWSRQIAVKIGKRAAALFAIGIAINLLNMVNVRNPHFVVMGDLQYVAITYGLTALLVLWLKRLRLLVGVVLMLIIIHYLMFALLPVPLVLRTLSYLVIVLAGYITITLSHGRASRLLLSLGLFIVGMSCFLIGSVWEYTVPLNITFVAKLMSYPWMFYAGLIFLIDVCKLDKWTYPLIIFGRTALFTYVLSATLFVLFGRIIAWTTPAGSPISLSEWFYKDVCAALFGNNEAGSFCYVIVCVLLMWVLAWLFYRWKIFIKA